MIINFFIGAAFLALAAFLAVREHRWLSKAQFTEGHVVEMIARAGRKGTTYRPRVHYTTMDGQQHEFVSSYASNPPDYTVGEKVTIAHDPQSGEGRIATFGQLFGFTWVLGAIGFALIAISAGFLVGRQYVPRIYMH